MYVPGQPAQGGNPAVAPKIEYVYFDGTDYVTKDVTSDLISLINSNESRTTILEFPVNSAKFYYISEQTILANNGITPTSPFETDGVTLRPGVVYIDVPESVIKNIETILDGTTTILKPGTTNEYYTVEEIVKLIASEVEGNVIYKNIGTDTDANWVFQYYNGTEYVTVNLDDLIAGLETKTQIKRAKAEVDDDTLTYDAVRTAPTNIKKGDVYYQYKAEGEHVDYINVTEDILYSITNNEDVRNEIGDIINNFLSVGGNVFYTATEIAAADNEGILVPEKSLFIIEEVGGVEVKKPIDISGTILTVIEDNSTAIKNLLGDKINNLTVIKTGDTFNGSAIYIYTNKTTIAANSAVTTGIEIPTGIVPAKIIGIKVLGTNGLVSNVTDVVITGQTINFNIGVGNMYQILGAGDYDVVIEFTE